MLGHVAAARISVCVKVHGVREVFTHQLQLEFHPVVFLSDLHGKGVFTVGIGNGAGSSELVAVDFALWATNVHILEGHR